MTLSLLLLIIFCFHLSVYALHLPHNVTVATSSKKGNYTKIADAILAAPKHSNHRYVIYIKKGVYDEQLNISVEQPNITLVGDGMGKTIITHNISKGIHHVEVDASATLNVDGERFLAINLTVRNTAGPKNRQAVALRSNSPHSAFYGLSIEGYQDTLYVQVGPQFYSECNIHGTIDFIFGEGPATFQKCRILARQGRNDSNNAITANGCTNGIYHNNPCGFSFHLCNLTADDDLLKSNSPTPTYLGRPWKLNSTTVFMECFMTRMINSSGWLKWDNHSFEGSVFYGEYKNSGEGAVVKDRVKWPGVHRSIDKSTAEKYTVSKFLNGEKWLPDLGVQFIPQLQ
ncbi:Plant invertase/pectin methylesterase inhibitor superfamily [Euphorbia peplus]|nr:Plant invertase/pectin methylesterase inhibitor superfamily [Euphorbia peplus]